jgi:hypothetical protein
MSVPLTFTQIKALTEVGDSPTNSDRADVWDSLEYYIQQALDTSADALAIAQANSLKAFGYLKLSRPAGGPAPTPAADAPVVYRTAGCAVAVAQVLAGVTGAPLYSTRITATITVTLTTANADAHYYASIVANPTETNGAGTLTALSTKVVSKTAGVVVFEVVLDFNAISGGVAYVQFQVFP